LRLVRALKRYWVNRGLPDLAHRLVAEALARPGAGERTLVRCRALADAGQLDSWMGRYAEAQGYLMESLAIARELGDRGRVEAALQLLGLTSLGQGNMSAARAYSEEALALARMLGNKRELAAALIALAQLDRVEGKLDTAEQLYEQAVSLARELGDRETIAIGLLNLAMAAIGRAQPDRAGGLLAEAIAIAGEIGSKPVELGVLDVCAGLAASHGDWEQAARFYGMVQAQASLTGLHRDPSDEAFLAPLIAKARKALGAAAFDAANARSPKSGDEESLAEARAWISRSGRRDRAG
jgi:tetratricopeptide (TPR) repeat protein